MEGASNGRALVADLFGETEEDYEKMGRNSRGRRRRRREEVKCPGK